MKLQEIIENYGIRGACCCGSCIDGIEAPEKHQPAGVNLTFFRVGVRSGLSANDFEKAVRDEHAGYFDGKEHSYLQVGADVGDQGCGLTLIGMGHELGVWNALSPDTVMPFLPPEMKMQLAGRGMVSLQAKPKETTPND